MRWPRTRNPSTAPIAGSRAMKVPNAVWLIRRSASISSANGNTGNNNASPRAASSTAGVR